MISTGGIHLVGTIGKAVAHLRASNGAQNHPSKNLSWIELDLETFNALEKSHPRKDVVEFVWKGRFYDAYEVVASCNTVLLLVKEDGLDTVAHRLLKQSRRWLTQKASHIGSKIFNFYFLQFFFRLSLPEHYQIQAYFDDNQKLIIRHLPLPDPPPWMARV
ncbi:MAG: hypothetical protein Kow0075_13820 [Salibacteraceae bacterium]